jgi:uncharacterized protein (TIGR00369 family)
MAAGKGKVAVKEVAVTKVAVTKVAKAAAKGLAAKGLAAKAPRAKTPAAKKASTPSGAAPFRQNGIVGANLIMDGQPARRLGVQLVSATRTKIVARLPIRPHHTNRGQRVNGGVLMAFADLLGAAGTVMNLEPGWRTTTLESKTNFFAAGQPPVLLAESTPLHVGRSTNVWQTRITNEDGRLVALVTQTQIVLPPPVVR